MPDPNNKGGNHEFCGQCTVCKIILSHQNKQLNNCTCGNPPRGAHWESCASLCTKSNYEGEEKCGICKHNTPCPHSRLDNIMSSLPPQENDWKEKFYTEFKSLLYEYPNTYEQILSFIKSLLALREQEAYERGLSKLGIEMGKKILAVDDARVSRDLEWKRAIEEKLLKSDFVEIAGLLSEIITKMSLSPEEEK